MKTCAHAVARAYDSAKMADETNAFTVPDRGVYSVTIHVTFKSIYDGYGIFVSVLDLMGTGNTVTADRDRAEEWYARAAEADRSGQ